MPETVTYDAERQLIRVQVWGENPIDDWVGSRAEVIRLYKTHGANRVFVDVREQESAPAISEIFEFGETWPEAISVAILMGENTRDDVRLLETVAFNRSKPIRIFYDEDDALAWLAAKRSA